MRMEHVARVYVRKTNHDPCDLLDVARRQVDQLGPAGMRAKAGQTDVRFLQKGYIRLVFPTRAMRRRFADRLREHCHSAAEVRFFRPKRR